MSTVYIPACAHGPPAQALCTHAGNALCRCCDACHWACYLALQYAPISREEIRQYRLAEAFPPKRP